jgi:hypothetical protein
MAISFASKDEELRGRLVKGSAATTLRAKPFH